MASSERAAGTEASTAKTGTAAGSTAATAGTSTGADERFTGAGDQARANTAGQPSGPVATATPVEAATISCLTNAHYHSGREAFLDTTHRWFMFLVIALGAAALTDALPRLLNSAFGISIDGSAIKEICAASAAIIAALDLTFDLSNRARAHSMMKRRYFELLADLREEQKTPEQVRVCLERFSADEEPMYRVLYLACWNSAQMTVFGRTAKRFDISFLGNLFKNWVRRPSATYPVVNPRA
jgi:hypothetical protein